MRITTLPAQVTTVEDRILGNLSFIQMLLIVAPVFSSAVLFAVLPPAMTASVYKTTVLLLLITGSCLLAVRLKGKLILNWFVILLRFHSRPGCYVFQKNSLYLRQEYREKCDKDSSEAVIVARERVVRERLKVTDRMAVEKHINSPTRQVRFMATKKGGLNVRITEIET